MLPLFGVIVILISGIALIRTLLRKNASVFANFLEPALKGMEESVERETARLLERAKTEVAARMEGVPDVWKEGLKQVADSGFDSVSSILKPKKDSFDFANEKAVITITNDPIQPFQLSPKMAKECERVIEGKVDDFSKAHAIFDWFQANISYDQVRAHENGKYRNAKEVFEEGKGICGEMAFLYVVMAWYSGISSATFVSVDVDRDGKKVHHACAAFQHQENWLLVDPAYGAFDARHQKYETWDNQKAVRIFKSWN